MVIIFPSIYTGGPHVTGLHSAVCPWLLKPSFGPVFFYACVSWNITIECLMLYTFFSPFQFPNSLLYPFVHSLGQFQVTSLSAAGNPHADTDLFSWLWVCGARCLSSLEHRGHIHTRRKWLIELLSRQFSSEIIEVYPF